MLDWILQPDHVWRTLVALAIATPPAGIAVGALMARRGRRDVWREPALWIGAGAGPLLLILWVAFNAIEDHYGLDSLIALGLNAALFLVVGLALGLWLRFGRPKRMH